MSKRNSVKHRRKILHIYGRKGSGVSKALWPSPTYLCVATSKVAQRRRVLLLYFTNCIEFLNSLSRRRAHFLARRVTIARAIQVGLILFSASIFLAMPFFYNWSVLITLAVACMLVLTMAIVIVIPVSISDRQVMPSPNAKTTPRGQRHSSLHPFPDTPMPSTPLIRVLETIDLSQFQLLPESESQLQSALEAEKHPHDINMAEQQ